MEWSRAGTVPDKEGGGPGDQVPHGNEGRDPVTKGSHEGGYPQDSRGYIRSPRLELISSTGNGIEITL